jgi:hypothetical protein
MLEGLNLKKIIDMNKKIKIAIAVLCSLMFIYGSGQPVIQYNSHSPQVGDVSNFYVIPELASVDPGASGAGVLWDFSQFSTDNLFTDSYLDPSVTPFAGLLENCNLSVFHGPPGPEAYTFCDQNSSQLAHTGGGWDEEGQLFYWEFSNPIVLRVYPFGYNDEHYDDYAFAMDYNQIGQDMVIDVTGNITSVADAYGTLVCATGKYENVLRIKSTYNEVVKTYMMGNLISTIPVVTVFYEWFTASGKFPVFQIQHIQGKQESFAIHYASEYSDIEEQFENMVVVFPNPARNNVTLTLVEPNDIQSIDLVDSKGSLIRKYPVKLLANDEFSLNLMGLKPGVYFIRIQRFDGICISKKLLLSGQH